MICRFASVARAGFGGSLPARGARAAAALGGGPRPRWLHATQAAGHGGSDVGDDAEDVRVVFVLKDESEKEVVAKEGQNLLEVAHKHDVDLEGACEGSIACSTCHVILEDDVFESLPEACEEEEDMLDLAFGLTPTSRLGCQVQVNKGIEGTKVVLPKATRNMYVDGHVPKPH